MWICAAVDFVVDSFTTVILVQTTQKKEKIFIGLKSKSKLMKHKYVRSLVLALLFYIFSVAAAVGYLNTVFILFAFFRI